MPHQPVKGTWERQQFPVGKLCLASLVSNISWWYSTGIYTSSMGKKTNIWNNFHAGPNLIYCDGGALIFPVVFSSMMISHALMTGIPSFLWANSSITWEILLSLLFPLFFPSWISSQTIWHSHRLQGQRKGWSKLELEGPEEMAQRIQPQRKRTSSSCQQAVLFWKGVGISND